MAKPEILLTKAIYAPASARLEREFAVHKPWLASDRDAYIEQKRASVRMIRASFSNRRAD